MEEKNYEELFERLDNEVNEAYKNILKTTKTEDDIKNQMGKNGVFNTTVRALMNKYNMTYDELVQYIRHLNSIQVETPIEPAEPAETPIEPAEPVETPIEPVKLDRIIPEIYKMSLAKAKNMTELKELLQSDLRGLLPILKKEFYPITYNDLVQNLLQYGEYSRNKLSKTDKLTSVAETVIQTIDKSESYFNNNIDKTKQKIDEIGTKQIQADSGINETYVKIVRNMINEGISIDAIAKILNLDSGPVELEAQKYKLEKAEKELEKLKDQQKKFNEAKNNFIIKLQEQYNQAPFFKELKENDTLGYSDFRNKTKASNFDYDKFMKEISKSFYDLTATIPENVKGNIQDHLSFLYNATNGVNVNGVKEFVSGLLNSKMADINYDLKEQRNQLLLEIQSITEELQKDKDNYNSSVLMEKLNQAHNKLNEINQHMIENNKNNVNYNKTTAQNPAPTTDPASNPTIIDIASKLGNKQVNNILSLNDTNQSEPLKQMADEYGVSVTDLVDAANHKVKSNYSEIVLDFKNNPDDAPVEDFISRVKEKEKAQIRRVKEARSRAGAGFWDMFSLNREKRQKVKNIRNISKARIKEEKKASEYIREKFYAIDEKNNKDKLKKGISEPDLLNRPGVVR